MNKVKHTHDGGFCISCITEKQGSHVALFIERGNLKDVMLWATNADKTTLHDLMKGIRINKK